MEVKLENADGKRNSRLSLTEMLKKSGIAKKAFIAFLELSPRIVDSNYTPAKDLKLKDCRFGIEYWCGFAFEEEPSNLAIKIIYPTDNLGYKKSMFVALDNSRGSSEPHIELDLEQWRLVRRLVRKDIISRILVAAQKYITSDIYDEV